MFLYLTTRWHDHASGGFMSAADTRRLVANKLRASQKSGDKETNPEIHYLI